MSESKIKIVPVYTCQVGWENLKPTETDGVRWCGDCEQRVFEVTDANDLRAAVAAGKCVRSLVPDLHHLGEMQVGLYTRPTDYDPDRDG